MAGFSRKKYMKLAEGFYGRAKNCLRITIPRVEKSLVKAYIGRKLRRRTVRREWIATINSATRDLDMKYSHFICGLNRSNIKLDRKILADLAKYEPYSFKAVVDEVKVQFEYYQQKRKYTIEEMVKRNLLTNTKHSKEEYNKEEIKDIQFRY